jgi:hypothetical protein
MSDKNKNKNKLRYASFHQGYSQKHVAITQHPPGSADRVFPNACRVSLSQQYHRVQHLPSKKK